MSDFKVVEMPGRTTVSSGRKWEEIVGYCRAVKIGTHIAVTGTVGIRDDGSYPETAAEQMTIALQTIIRSLAALGASARDVIRTRIFVTDIEQWQEIGRVHQQFFGELRPATTMVQISRLIDEKACVEVEADACVQE